MVHLLDVAVTVHYETVTAKMVLHVEMHDIKYGLGSTYHEFSEIMHRVYAGSCSFNKDYTNGLHPNSDGVRRPLANIVQRVKSCYKIKIDSRVPDCCFYGVLLCKQHPSLTIAPLLHYNSATIRV